MKKPDSPTASGLFEGLEGTARRFVGMMPVVILLGVIVLELLSTGIRLTPTLLTLGLAVMAPFLPPARILAWSAVYFAATVASLVFAYNGPNPELPAVVVLRSIVFLVVAVLAFRISRFHELAKQQAAALMVLFDSLRTPLVVSDADGGITHANRACCELLGKDLGEVKDSTFSSLFTHPQLRGKSIEQYLARFDPGEPSSSRMRLAVRKGGGHVDLEAFCVLLDVSGTKLLVTQLDEVGGGAGLPGGAR